MSEQAGDDAVEPAVRDGPVAEWTHERAEELDLEPHEFVERVLGAYKRAEAGEDFDPTPVEELDAVRSELSELESTVESLIEDVRERVIQVKRETDEKAPADHDHPDVAERIETTEASVESLEESVESVRTRLDRGFDNYEEILEYLLSRTDDLTATLETVGTAVLELEKKVDTIAAREHRRTQADRLQKTAAKHGVRTAKCESCQTKVEVALLSEPACPSCEATFRDLEPNPGFFGTSKLLTGSRPALEGPSETPATDELASVIAATAEAADRSRREDWFDADDSSEASSEAGEDEGSSADNDDEEESNTDSTTGAKNGTE